MLIKTRFLYNNSKLVTLHLFLSEFWLEISFFIIDYPRIKINVVRYELKVPFMYTRLSTFSCSSSNFIEIFKKLNPNTR